MAMTLTFDVIARTGNTKSELRDVEQAVRGVEHAAAASVRPLTESSKAARTVGEAAPVVQRTAEATRALATAQDGGAATAAKLEGQTRRLGGEFQAGTGAATGFRASVASLMTAIAGAGVIDRALGFVTSWTAEAVRSADATLKMSLQTGMSLEAVQRFEHVARSSGVSVKALGDAAFTLGVKLAGGSGSVRAAIQALGLEYDLLRRAQPEAQFNRIASALEGTESAQERNRIAVALFGQKADDVLPAITSGYTRLATEARVAGDAQVEALATASRAWDRFVADRKADTTAILGSFAMLTEGAAKLTPSQLFALLFTHGFDSGAILSGLAVLDDMKPRRSDIHLSSPSSSSYVADLAEQRRLLAGLTEGQRAEIRAGLALGHSEKEIAGERGVTEELIRLLRENDRQQASQQRERQRAQEKADREFIGDWFKRTQPRNDHPWEMVRGLGLTGFDFVQMGLTRDVMAKAWRDFGRPRNDNLWSMEVMGIPMPDIPGQNPGWLRRTRPQQSWLERRWAESEASQWAQFGLFRAAPGQKLSGLAKGVNVAANAGQFGLSLLDMFGLGNSRAAQSLNLGLQGMGVGAAFGPWGAAIGGGVGVIASLFGKSQGRRDLEAANKDIRGMQADLLAQFGSIENIRALDRIMGTDLAGGWGHQNVAGKQAFSAEASRFMSGADAAMNQMIRSALVAGEQIPEAMMPILETLIRMGGLTQENANLLRGLPAEGIPSMREIQEAAALLGVDVGALGDKVKQIGLSENAEAAAKAWKLLERAGADMSVVGQAAAEQMQGYVDEAIQYGFSLPESLRPAIERMKEMGLISGDLEDIDWAKPLSDSVADLVEALRALVATLRGEVTPAIDAIDGRTIEVPIRVPVRLESSEGHVPGDLPTFHSGGFLDAVGTAGTARCLSFGRRPVRAEDNLRIAA
ncbi:MAG TPA: hypothetical protein VM364_04675 [Vicinamibacterales bacterium]|nr:hypothetical protein [Vicinamibacterales bacterium]